MLETTAPLPVREALAAAKVILQAGHGSHDVVLDSTGYSDVMAAVLAATSSFHHPVAGITYETVVLEATYDCHGAHLIGDQTIASPDGTYLTVVVAIHAAYQVDASTRGPLVASVAADLRGLEDEMGAHAAERIFVLMQPSAPATSPAMVDALGAPVAVGDTIAVSQCDITTEGVDIQRSTISEIRGRQDRPSSLVAVAVVDGSPQELGSESFVRLG